MPAKWMDAKIGNVYRAAHYKCIAAAAHPISRMTWARQPANSPSVCSKSEVRKNCAPRIETESSNSLLALLLAPASVQTLAYCAHEWIIAPSKQIINPTAVSPGTNKIACNPHPSGRDAGIPTRGYFYTAKLHKPENSVMYFSDEWALVFDYASFDVTIH